LEALFKPLQNIPFVIANTFAALSAGSVKQSHKGINIKEIAASLCCLAKTDKQIFKGFLLPLNGQGSIVIFTGNTDGIAIVRPVSESN
jgi:hypothetical protein